MDPPVYFEWEDHISKSCGQILTNVTIEEVEQVISHEKSAPLKYSKPNNYEWIIILKVTCWYNGYSW